MGRDKLKETIESAFLLGQLFQAYVSMLMVYPAAKRDERLPETLSRVILHIQSLCSTLGIKSPCEAPADDKDASRMLKNFVTTGGQLVNDLRLARGATVGATFLFASSCAAHHQLSNLVEGDLRKAQLESLEALGSEIGLGGEDVKAYLERPAGCKESLVRKIINHVTSHDAVVLSKIDEGRKAVVELKPSFHG